MVKADLKHPPNGIQGAKVKNFINKFGELKKSPYICKRFETDND